MRLIATLGATRAIQKHTYFIDDAKYTVPFSFLALKEHFGIDDRDTYIIGTQKTIEELGEQIKAFHFVQVDENSMEDIFQKSVDLLQEGDIVDLTQSFRSVPFGVLLSLSFSKSLGKRAENIFYAQAKSHDCHPVHTSCEYGFVSLKRYDEITDLARSINTFNATLLVLDDLHITIKAFSKLHRSLKKLSTKIFNNNFDAAAQQATEIDTLIEQELLREEFSYLHQHLKSLQEEMKKIRACDKPKESETLLAWSAYLYSKDIMLHAITTLYESMVAFLDEELKIEACTWKENRRGKRYRADTYDRRNCLKKQMKNCSKLKEILDCETFSKKLREVDKLRNISAHAFTSDKTEKDIGTIIASTLDYLKKHYPKRISGKKGVDRLQSAFSNR